MVHAVVYGWTGYVEVKAPGEYEYRRLAAANWDMLPSRMITMKAASLILFGDYPKPRRVMNELENKWLPRGTSVRYMN